MIQNLFETPIYSKFLENYQEIQTEIDQKIGDINFTAKESWGNPHYLSTSTFKDCIITQHNFVKIRHAIHNNLIEYCKEIDFGIRSYTMTSWFALFNKNNYGQLHNHGSADISGVYYYKTNEEDGDLFFENPAPAVKTSLCFYDKYAQRMTHKPAVGKFLLFPAYLDHGIMSNNTENTRISLAFNIVFNR
jgi:uncharacterized protein (TIGR02466 family)